MAGTDCNQVLLTDERELAQNTNFYIAAGAITCVEVLVLARLKVPPKLSFYILVKTLDLMTDWANYAISYQTNYFYDGCLAFGIDPDAMVDWVLGINILSSLCC